MSDYDEGYRAGMQKMRDLAPKRIEDLETKLEELEALLMDVVADLRDGVSADKIDYRIGKVILRMDQ